MALSISNIAWDVAFEPAVFEVLRQHDVTHIDVAPTKYITDVTRVDEATLAQLKQRLADAGFQALGMQSLLFGTQGLNVFADNTTDMLAHLDEMCRIGHALDARRLVFGSPRNRDKSVLAEARVLPYAKQFFTRLGEIARSHEVTICLEPNPTCYGANFMVDSAETAEVVAYIDHPNIKMQLDVGAMQINDEQPDKVLSQYHELIGHVHISQPQLAPVTDNRKYHQCTADALRRYLPDMSICIEMLTKGDDRVQQIADSVAFVQAVYE